MELEGIASGKGEGGHIRAAQWKDLATARSSVSRHRSCQHDRTCRLLAGTPPPRRGVMAGSVVMFESGVYDQAAACTLIHSANDFVRQNEDPAKMTHMETALMRRG